MLVLRGEGQAIVNQERIDITAGTLLLIEAGENHEIRNTGTSPLQAINFYAPKES